MVLVPSKESVLTLVIFILLCDRLLHEYCYHSLLKKSIYPGTSLHFIVSAIIATSDSLTAGDPFTLECYISGINESAMFELLGPPNNHTLMADSNRSRIVTSNSTVSLLKYTMLRASHNGVYTCLATVRNTTLKDYFTVTVNSEFFITIMTNITFKQ